MSDVAVLMREGVSVQMKGQRTTVSTDPYARLMYYLDCVSSLISRNIPDEYCDYHNHRGLTSEKKAAILALAVLLSPDELVGKIIFMVPAGSASLQGSSNKFYDLQHSQQFVAVDESVMVGGERTTVFEIMICTEGWLRDNFLNPLVQLQDDVRGLVRGEMPRGDYTRATALPSSRQNIRLTKDWNHGWCSCCARGPINAVSMWLFFPCAVGMLFNKMSNAECICCSALSLCWIPCALYSLRTEAIAKYNIDEDEDLVLYCAWCCFPFTYPQTVNEIQDQEGGSVGILGCWQSDYA